MINNHNPPYFHAESHEFNRGYFINELNAKNSNTIYLTVGGGNFSGDIELLLAPDMSIGKFGDKNNIPKPVLKKVFNVQQKQNLQKKISEMEITLSDIESTINKALALEEEHQSKNWIKIPIKFGLCFYLIRKFKITSGVKKKVSFIGRCVRCCSWCDGNGKRRCRSLRCQGSHF